MSAYDDIVAATDNFKTSQDQLKEALAAPAADGSRFDLQQKITLDHTLISLDSLISTLVASTRGIIDQSDLTLVPLKSLKAAASTPSLHRSKDLRSRRPSSSATTSL